MVSCELVLRAPMQDGRERGNGLRLFIGRFWSFRPEHLPFITFARAVYRDNLLAEAAAGDRIAMVVTQKESVIPEKRGRLLGIAEIGTRAIDTADVASSSTMTPREWLGGEPRCPKAIPMVRAWRFLQSPAVPPDINAALPLTTGGPAILLRAKQAAQIMSFAYEAAALRQSRWPLEGVRAVRAGTGEVFALRFGNRDVWRIGNSFDPERGLKAMNRNIPRDVTQEGWAILQRHPVASEAEALVFETNLTALLMDHEIDGAFFACGPVTFERAWNETLAQLRDDVVMTSCGLR